MRRLALLAAVLALAGCGGTAQRAATKPPRLPHDLAQAWAQQSDAIASALAVNDGCTAQQLAGSLRDQVVQAVNARRVPRRLLETLVGAVNDLPERITCNPPPPPADTGPPYGKAKGHKDHGKHKGHGGDG